MKQLLSGKPYQETKERMYHEQNGKCCLCKRNLDYNIQKNHLDHDHALDGPNAGKVRGLLCINCNATEGRMKHKFVSSGLASKGVDYIEWLESLLEYLKKDYSDSVFHPQYITDIIKQFKRLSLTDMQSEMIKRNYEFNNTDKKADLVKKFSRQFRKEQKKL